MKKHFYRYAWMIFAVGLMGCNQRASSTGDLAHANPDQGVSTDAQPAR